MTIGIGVVGCGRWGMNYLRVLGELEGCQIVAACDVSPERLRDAVRRAPSLRAVTDLSELIRNPLVDAVVVATDATRHFAVAKSALEAGKDCLVEKPMTTDVDGARRLRDIAQRAGRLLMVGHLFRYNPAIQFMQQLFASGGIGGLEYLYFTRTNLGPIRSDINVVWDLMTHDISILLHFLNRSPRWISAQGASYLRRECEDVAFATLGFQDGVVANIRASWLDPRKVREITVVGTAKMVVFDDLDLDAPVRIYDKGTFQEPVYNSFGEFKLLTRTGDILSPAIPAAEPLRRQCEHFLEGLTNHRAVLSDGEDGVRVVEILAAINRSIAQKGAPVELVPELALA